MYPPPLPPCPQVIARERRFFRETDWEKKWWAWCGWKIENVNSHSEKSKIHIPRNPPWPKVCNSVLVIRLWVKSKYFQHSLTSSSPSFACNTERWCQAWGTFEKFDYCQQKLPEVFKSFHYTIACVLRKIFAWNFFCNLRFNFGKCHRVKE